MAEPKTREITLPSGRKAVIREGFGRDLMRAQKVAKTVDEIPMALVAQLVEIDGAAVLYEDLLDMNLPDVLMLQGRVMSGNFDSPPAPTSPV
ncbi:MAG TPA: hypothetical protein VKS22_12120 [Candidatus Binataceae bacterium]|nr:hypothetical protein [Candidatus Binataceae bacterium]